MKFIRLKVDDNYSGIVTLVIINKKPQLKKSKVDRKLELIAKVQGLSNFIFLNLLIVTILSNSAANNNYVHLSRMFVREFYQMRNVN